MSASLAPYLSLVPAANSSKPNFIAALSALLQGHADIAALEQAIPGLFDLDVAVGQQLDYVGQWIGITRYLQVPISPVYFSLDTVGLGLDQGTWQGKFDPTTQISALADDAYRTLLRAKIAANHWNGTIPSAEALWDALFYPNYSIGIVDHQNMTMDLILYSNTGVADAVTSALFLGGYLDIRPAGVAITNRYILGTQYPVYDDFSVDLCLESADELVIQSFNPTTTSIQMDGAFFF